MRPGNSIKRCHESGADQLWLSALTLTLALILPLTLTLTLTLTPTLYRLKHIIEQYADGPGVLLELVQNADDAGASEVSFLLDTKTYASNSVLGAAMVKTVS